MRRINELMGIRSLRNFDDEESLRESLGSIPDFMAQSMELEKSLYIDSVRSIHAVLAHWTTRLAYAKSSLQAAKAAKEVGLEHAKLGARQALKAAGGKFTEAMVTEVAKTSEMYKELLIEEIEKQRENLKIQGLVDAIITKRESLKMLSFFVNAEASSAMDSTSYLGSDLEKDLKEIAEELGD